MQWMRIDFPMHQFEYEKAVVRRIDCNNSDLWSVSVGHTRMSDMSSMVWQGMYTELVRRKQDGESDEWKSEVLSWWQMKDYSEAKIFNVGWTCGAYEYGASDLKVYKSGVEVKRPFLRLLD